MPCLWMHALSNKMYLSGVIKQNRNMKYKAFLLAALCSWGCSTVMGQDSGAPYEIKNIRYTQNIKSRK